eukprot:m.164961 g.164961  ORF g.164961 m.164961 type:complete len:517 (+) comp18118_c0_seq5:276-1826(+)
MAVDPLGVVVELQDPLELTHWGSGNDSKEPPVQESDGDAKPIKFIYDDDINKKISLWIDGDVSVLRSDAIVHSTNESLSESSTLSRQLHKVAGPELQAECTKIGSCRTGDVRVSKAYNLPCRYVFHTVGPRFNKRYRTAAESALFSCCRTTLTEMRERGLRTLGLTNINTRGRNFAAVDAAPIILRTIRRFLEKYGDDIDRIVLALSSDDMEVYNNNIPMYFPRSDAEALWSAANLPADIGNAEGEPVIEERKIRIETISFGTSAQNSDESDAESADEDEDAVNGEDLMADANKSGFGAMVGDHDRTRREQLLSRDPKTGQRDDVARQYQALLKQARRADLSDVAALKFCSVGGSDKLDRRVVSIVSKNIPAKCDLNRILMYIINAMDSIVNKPYILFHYHTNAAAGSAGVNIVKNLFAMTDDRYAHNLHRVYHVHTSFWLKTSMLFGSNPFSSNPLLKGKTETLAGGLRSVFDIVGGAEQVDVPQFVIAFDEKSFGKLNKQTGFITGGVHGGDEL